MLFQSIKKISISSECVACGLCFLCTDYISEDREGKAFVKNSGIFENKDIKKILEIIENCPVKAISIEKSRLTNKNGKEGLEELKKIIESEFGDYKLPLPSPDLYKFKKEEYSIEIPYSPEEREYKYKSYGKAEAEGLREFDRIMFSKRRTLVQHILIQYKNRYFNQFTEYKEIQGNYYYDIISKFKNRFREYVAEIKILSPNLDISKDFLEFNYKPIFGDERGSQFDRERNIYSLKNLETTWVAEDIIKDLEELKWYETYINWDDRTTYRGNKEVELYCYDLREAKEQLAKYIIDYSEFNLNNMMGAKEVLEQNLPYVMSEVIKGIKDKIHKLLYILDPNYNPNKIDSKGINIFDFVVKACQEASPKQKIANVVKNNMVPVSGGKFKPILSDEEIKVSNLEVSRYQVTQDIWTEIMKNNPSECRGEKLPVENITWWEALEFCNKLSEKQGLQPVYQILFGKFLKINQKNGEAVDPNLADFNKTEGYRLPTQVEWEWFARGGQVAIERGTFDTNYAGSENIDEIAWHGTNSIRRTHEVGTKKPNELNIYDCNGNIWEWCYDTSDKEYIDNKKSYIYNEGNPNRILKGGSCYSDVVSYKFRNHCRRDNKSHGFGFRIVRTAYIPDVPYENLNLDPTTQNFLE
ncbi:MAG: SUMF1/EgtB/PvdO family nonheme iron enzyme, partial [Bacilli bacterium]